MALKKARKSVGVPPTVEVKVTGVEGINWRYGTLHNHTKGLRVTFNGDGVAWVDPGTAEILRSENTVVVTDETREVVEA